MVTEQLRNFLTLLKHSEQIMHRKKMQIKNIDSLQLNDNSIKDFVDEMSFLLFSLNTLKKNRILKVQRRKK